MTIYDVISLFGGLALFLYGMRFMGDGLKKNGSGTMQKVLEKVTNNAFKGFVLGLCVTALIQSSTATIVLTAGLVAAGVLTFRQSIGIVLGANVGTTVTGQIIRLLDLDTSGAASWLNICKPSTLAPIAALIGIILIMFIKSKNSNVIGEIAMGFGILFTGLLNMSAAVEPLSKSQTFIALFTRFSGMPVLGFLVGCAVSSLIQSSSASVGMLQTLSTTGVLTFSSIYPILIGIYVGDALTTMIVCSIGTRADAKRTGLVTLMFNIFSVAFLMILVSILHATGLLEAVWSKSMTSGDIANTNTLFKLSSALFCVPFASLFYNLCLKFVKEKSYGTDIVLDAAMQKLDEKLFISPKMALESARKVISVMQRLATTNTDKAMKLLDAFDASQTEDINRREDCIDKMADAVDEYLIHFSAHVNSEIDSDELNYYLQCYSEMERIGDLATNIMENAEAFSRQSVALTDSAVREVGVLKAALQEILELSATCFAYIDLDAAAKIEPLEEVIDDLVAQVKKNHIKRLRASECSSDTGLIFVDLLTNIERISDQCSNIAVYTLAMHDAKIMHNRHEYIQQLHEGRNEFYNAEYSRQRQAYLPLLNA